MVCSPHIYIVFAREVKHTQTDTYVCVSAHFVVHADGNLYIYNSANDKKTANKSFSMSEFDGYVTIFTCFYTFL